MYGNNPNMGMDDYSVSQGDMSAPPGGFDPISGGGGGLEFGRGGPPGGPGGHALPQIARPAQDAAYRQGNPMYSGTYGKRFTSKLSDQEEEIIKVAFDSFRDENGFITTERLSEAFSAIDALSDIHDIQLLIDDIDENGDGKIDKMEFRHIMTRKFLGEDDDSSFVHTFRMLDADKDGYISYVEMRYLLMRQGECPLSEMEADEALMFADVEGDGLINYENFLRWLQNPPTVAAMDPKALPAAPQAPALTNNAASAPGKPAPAPSPGAGVGGFGGAQAGGPAANPNPAMQAGPAGPRGPMQAGPK